MTTLRFHSVTLALLTLGCAAAVTGRGGQDADGQLLHHLVRDLDTAFPGPVPWRIDPRPLRGPDEPADSSAETRRFAPIAATALASRVATILATGGDTTRMIEFAQCPGGMAVGLSHAGCPDVPVRIAAFGRLPGRVTDSGTVVIDAMLATLRPGGQAMRGYLIELRRAGERWITLSRINTGIAE